MCKMKGTTLLEISIVIVLLGVIAGVAGIILEKAAVSSLLYSNLNDMHWENRIAVERMTREISGARSNDPADFIMGANDITITDKDGQTIQYHLVGNVLQRDDQPLSGNVSSLDFTFLDGDLGEVDPAGDTTLVRYIRIELITSKNGNSTSVGTTIFPRGF